MNPHLKNLCRATAAAYARAAAHLPALYSFLPAGTARKIVNLGAATSIEADEIKYPSQLLVDVSEIARNDAGTGIQRVVRNILLQLLREPPSGYEVKPVYASRHEGYRYAERYRATLLAQDCGEHSDLPVQTRPGDIFLGLDLAAHLLPHHHRTLGYWKNNGIKLFFLMHDLFPVSHPEWFNPKRPRTFRRWLRTLAIYSDCVLCVSKATANDLERWLVGRYGIENGVLPVRSFHLGTDFSSVVQAPDQAAMADELNLSFQGRGCILMVGTIEPRKGYVQALAAFEALWQQDIQVNLVIVGKAGWKVDGLVTRLRQHPEAGLRLHWFENADDEKLRQLYTMADGLLMASEAEGFGLPVIEASRFDKPLLLRDIPVFREISGAGAEYFKGVEPEALTLALRNWLSSISARQSPASGSIKCQNWAESTAQLVLAMELTGYRS